MLLSLAHLMEQALVQISFLPFDSQPHSQYVEVWEFLVKISISFLDSLLFLIRFVICPPKE